MGRQIQRQYPRAALRLRASLDAFVAKNIDACAMTNMEALDMPAAAGIDTTAIITGDYSNGNDALLTRRGLTLQQLSGKKVLLVEKTVSEYLFERAMTLNGLESQIKKVKLVNTSDSDIATAFIADTSQDAVVTWKPMVSQIAKTKGVTDDLRLVADSGRDPGPDGGADRHSEPARRIGRALRQGAGRRMV